MPRWVGCRRRLTDLPPFDAMARATADREVACSPRLTAHCLVSDMPYSTDPAEQRRLAQLQALQVLDSEPEPLFDTLTRLASEICGTPIALVSLIDADRQWFKANVGLPGVGQTPRDVAFCDHAIRQDGLFEVSDAAGDLRFAANPLVTGQPGIRFYAGAPLVLPAGDRIGTLCVIDREARQLTPQQADMLQQLARAVVEALQMRREIVERSRTLRHAEDLALAESEARWRAILDTQSELVSQATPDGRLLYLNPSYAAYFGRTVDEMLGSNLYDHVDPAARDLVRQRIAQVLATGEVMTSENRMSLPDGAECWIAWTNTRQFDRTGQPCCIRRVVTSPPACWPSAGCGPPRPSWRAPARWPASEAGRWSCAPARSPGRTRPSASTSFPPASSRRWNRRSTSTRPSHACRSSRPSPRAWPMAGPGTSNSSW